MVTVRGKRSASGFRVRVRGIVAATVTVTVVVDKPTLQQWHTCMVDKPTLQQGGGTHVC